MQSKEKLFNFCNSLIDDYTPATVVLSGIATAAIVQLRNTAFGAVQIIMLLSNLCLYEVHKSVFQPPCC